MGPHFGVIQMDTGSGPRILEMNGFRVSVGGPGSGPGVQPEGSILGVSGWFWAPQFGVFYLQRTIIVRARAYNDCAQHVILLKTRSTGPLGCPF